MILNDLSNNSGRNIPTASQTVGPFFSIGLLPHNPNHLVPTKRAAGAQIVTLRGRVVDGDGRGVPDAILEIWRAGENGLYASSVAGYGHDGGGVPSGFARIPTNEQGEFEFRTIKPGAIEESNGKISAPHLTVLIFMRGLLRHLLTRIYFPQEQTNETDPVLGAVPAERRKTLIAVRCSRSRSEFQWDVFLQGDAETVFFEA
jgi:protocatechuate 3,4-dioxygenase alpha subunit